MRLTLGKKVDIETGGGGGRVDVEVVFGGHPPLHEVTMIVDVVKEVEMYVVEF